MITFVLMITFVTHLIAFFAGCVIGIILADNLTGDNNDE